MDVAIPASRRARELATLMPAADTGRVVRLRLRRELPRAPSELVDGIAVSTVPQILVELIREGRGDLAARVWREADFLGLLKADAIAELAASRQPGTPTLRALARRRVVRDGDTAPETRAEHLLIEALLELGAPRPRSNAPLQLDQSWYYPDLWFVRQRKVVEVDGPIHDTPARRVEDQARDLHMRAHGIDVLRVDRDAVLADPHRSAAQVCVWLAG